MPVFPAFKTQEAEGTLYSRLHSLHNKFYASGGLDKGPASKNKNKTKKIQIFEHRSMQSDNKQETMPCFNFIYFTAICEQCKIDNFSSNT